MAFDLYGDDDEQDDGFFGSSARSSADGFEEDGYFGARRAAPVAQPKRGLVRRVLDPRSRLEEIPPPELYASPPPPEFVPPTRMETLADFGRTLGRGAREALHGVGAVATLPWEAVNAVAQRGARAFGIGENTPNEEFTADKMVRQIAGLDDISGEQGAIEEGVLGAAVPGYAAARAVAPEYAKRLLGKGVEFGARMGLDPVTYTGLGLEGTAGRVAGGAMAADMALGMADEAERMGETLGREGFSPKAAEEMLGTALSAAMVGTGVRHALTPHAAPGPRTRPADYQYRSRLAGEQYKDISLEDIHLAEAELAPRDSFVAGVNEAFPADGVYEGNVRPPVPGENVSFPEGPEPKPQAPIERPFFEEPTERPFYVPEEIEPGPLVEPAAPKQPTVEQTFIPDVMPGENESFPAKGVYPEPKKKPAKAAPEPARTLDEIEPPPFDTTFVDELARQRMPMQPTVPEGYRIDEGPGPGEFVVIGPDGFMEAVTDSRRSAEAAARRLADGGPPDVPPDDGGGPVAPVQPPPPAGSPPPAERRTAPIDQRSHVRRWLDEHPNATREEIAAEAEAYAARLSETDETTGLLNKRGWKRALAEKAPEDHVVYVDLLKFKPLNDKIGHAAGDEALANVGALVKKHFGERSARQGGDEFGGILSGMTAEEANARAEAFREELAQHKGVYRNKVTGEELEVPGFEAHIGVGLDEATADAAAGAAADRTYAAAGEKRRGAPEGEGGAKPTSAGAGEQPGVGVRGLASSEVPPHELADTEAFLRNEALAELSKKGPLEPGGLARAPVPESALGPGDSGAGPRYGSVSRKAVFGGAFDGVKEPAGEVVRIIEKGKRDPNDPGWISLRDQVHENLVAEREYFVKKKAERDAVSFDPEALEAAPPSNLTPEQLIDANNFATRKAAPGQMGLLDVKPDVPREKAKPGPEEPTEQQADLFGKGEMLARSEQMGGGARVPVNLREGEKLAPKVRPAKQKTMFAAKQGGGETFGVDREKVQNAFRSGKVQDTEGGWVVDLPNGSRVHVRMVEGGIEIRPGAFEGAYGRERAEGERVVGAWKPIGRNGIIWLAKGGAGQDTVHHEVFHAAMSLALSKAERDAVLKKYGSEEAAAHAYGEWNPTKPNSWFTKIAAMFKRLARNLIPGFEADQRVFERVRSGEAFKQRGGKVAEGEAFAAQKVAPTFYSQLQRIAGKMPQAMSGKDALRYLTDPKRGEGRLGDEAKWTGLDDYLKERAGQKVTPKEIQEFLKQNEVRVEEVERGAPRRGGELPTFTLQEYTNRNGGRDYHVLVDGKSWRDIGGYYGEAEALQRAERLWKDEAKGLPTKFSQYTLPGGENYRELLLTLPQRGNERLAELRTKGGRRTWQETAEYYTLLREEGRQSVGDFQSSHFNEPNILAHVRFNERTDAQGKRVLFIEEVQSDWAQRGRRDGFQTENPTAKALMERNAQIERETPALRKRYFELLSKVPTDERGLYIEDTPEMRAANEASRPLKELLREQERNAANIATMKRMHTGVPDAPFVGSTEKWSELAFKRMLRYAAENGFDRVAWTKGEQQAARYDLAKHVDSVTINRHTENGGGFQVSAEKDGRKVIPLQEAKTVNDLASIVGKDLADKAAQLGPAEEQTYSGLDLKVGGEGMKGFYDQILPATVSKLGKKWGARVGETRIASDKGIDPVRESNFRQAMARHEFTGPDTERLIQRWDRGGRDEALQLDPQAVAAFEAPSSNATLPVHSIDITDAMRRSVVEEGQPMFATRNAPYNVPEATRVERINRAVADRYADFERMVKTVREKGGQVPALFDELHGIRTAGSKKANHIQTIERQFAEPVVKLLKDAKIKYEDASDYVMAKHAPDANRELLRRNAMGHSGMSNNQAAAIIARARQNGTAPVLERVAKEVQKLNDWKLRLATDPDGGIYTPSQVAQFKRSWGDWWVPTRDDAILPDNSIFHAELPRGFDVRRKLQARTGRGTRAIDPLAAAFVDAQNVAIAVENNRVTRGLVELHRMNPLLADIVDPTPQNVPQMNPKTGRVASVKAALAMRSDKTVVGYKENGQQKYLKFEHPNPDQAAYYAAAFKDMGRDDLGAFARNLRPVTRFMASASTRHNPVFSMVFNPIKDALGTVPTVAIEHGPDVAASVAKRLLPGQGLRTSIFREIMNPGTGANPEFRRYVDAGGKISNYDFRDIETMGSDLKAQVEGGKMHEAAETILKVTGAMNDAMEAATRFALFKELRQRGVSEAKAIVAARNVSLDFDKRGMKTAEPAAVYAFLNAHAQGTRRLFELAAKNPKRFSAVAGTLVGLGLMQDLIGGSMAGDSDDDGVNDYDQMPQWARESNYVLGKVMIPAPPGFSFLHAIGTNLGSLMRGAETKKSAAVNMALAVHSALNPVGGEGFGKGDATKSFGLMMMPTALKPLAEIAANQTVLGSPVRPEQPKFGAPKPQSELHFKSVNWLAKQFAQGVLPWVGIDRSPEDIEQLFTGYLGGLGRTVSQVGKVGGAVLSGEAPEARNIPVVSRVYYEAHPSEQGRRYYESVKELQDTTAKARELRQAKKGAEAKELEQGILRARGAFDAAHVRLKSLTEARKKAETEGRDTKMLDDSINAVYRKANKAYAQARQRAGMPALADR